MRILNIEFITHIITSFLGIYTCIATTDNTGTDTRSGRLTVVEIASFMSSTTSSTIDSEVEKTTTTYNTPKYSSVTTNSFLDEKESLPRTGLRYLEGMDVELKCKSEGYITSIKMWYKVIK